MDATLNDLISNKIGTSFWFDLPVLNLLDAMSFYDALLGWKYVQMKDSNESDYVMIQANGTLIGGLRHVKTSFPERKDLCVPVLYFTVDHLNIYTERAKQLGAIMVGEKINLGQDRGIYQWIRDREKNLIALWAPSL